MCYKCEAQQRWLKSNAEHRGEIEVISKGADGSVQVTKKLEHEVHIFTREKAGPLVGGVSRYEWLQSYYLN